MSLPSGLISFLVVLAIVSLAGILNYVFSFLQWYMAVSSGISISLTQILRMRMRGIPVSTLLDNLVKARHFKIDVTWEQLQELHTAGGNPYNVIDGMVTGQKYGLNIPYERAVSADLQKINIPKSVEIIARKKGLK